MEKSREVVGFLIAVLVAFFLGFLFKSVVGAGQAGQDACDNSHEGEVVRWINCD